MHGGIKTFRNSPAAARHYVEADRARADDYYLAEETGIADRYVASLGEGVRRLEPLTGDGYEAWVAGVDPDTGQPRGRLRGDARAVRFVEVTVNGPKSWSLAAELHPDIGAAYDAAQDRAAVQIIGWLAHHATTRVGPRGGQIQIPVQQIEAVTVRHRTSRAGDPHRHLHLQVNARIFAEGQWRGLHTVGVRDSLDAINGIGHAAVATDPQFRDALAAHGFTLGDDGEIVELSPFVGAFSARAAQIGRNIERYEAAWRAANPGREPDEQQWRAWDARAWADGRPDKVVPRDGAELSRRWVAELHALGYREQRRSVPVDTVAVGTVDRDAAVDEALTRLAARRSGWNAADIRGQVEHFLARTGVVTDSSVRVELAEDLTARALAECVALTDRVGLPEHIRSLTSRHVLDVEAELTGRLAARGSKPSGAAQPAAVDAGAGLDAAQRDVVTALAGDAHLVVVEGAAGAGKTTTLAAARAAIETRGSRLRVVTPTRKAARVAAEQVGPTASSAAWLAFQHGFRWDEHGRWTRLQHGAIDSDTGLAFVGPGTDAVLSQGDLLLIDEAGMLDQDTARALLTIADEQHLRVAMVGDRHQLPAVGRGGVLELAARWAAPECCLTLDTVHRFTRTETTADGAQVTVLDEDYAKLSLAMRDATGSAELFDALVERDQIRVHLSEHERITALASVAVDAARGKRATVILADTKEQVAQLNAAIRDRLVAAGAVDDNNTTATDVGQRIGRGDRVATRRNDNGIGVANRDTWMVTAVSGDGSLRVHGDLGERSLPAEYVRQHVELAYASTVHGVQGDTATAAHTAIGAHSTAASTYVAMTRGRENNVAHLVADNLHDARDQWAAAFTSDRADLGPAHAAELAEHEAGHYAEHRPLEQALGELRDAWTVETDARSRLADPTHRRDLLRDIVTLAEQRDATLPALRQAHDRARSAESAADTRLRDLEPLVAAATAEMAATLQTEWDAQRQPAREAARAVRRGTGRLGQRRATVRDACDYLDQWAAAWRPSLTEMPESCDDAVGFAARFDDTPRHHQTLAAAARAHVEQAHPDYVNARHAAEQTHEDRSNTWRELHEAEQYYSIALQHYGSLGSIDNPAERLTQENDAITADTATLTVARARITALRGEPTLRAQPPETVELARADWSADRQHRASWLAVRAAAERETPVIEPAGREWGGVLENLDEQPEHGIGR